MNRERSTIHELCEWIGMRERFEPAVVRARILDCVCSLNCRDATSDNRRRKLDVRRFKLRLLCSSSEKKYAPRISVDWKWQRHDRAHHHLRTVARPSFAYCGVEGRDREIGNQNRNLSVEGSDDFRIALKVDLEIVEIRLLESSNHDD